MEDNVKKHLVEMPKLLIMGMSLLIFFAGSHAHNLYAQERPIKEFSITVQEMTITLLEDPKKEATVWAYALKGSIPR
jgi:hypothetical protein